MSTGKGKKPRRWPLVIYKGQTLREHRVWKVGGLALGDDADLLFEPEASRLFPT